MNSVHRPHGRCYRELCICSTAVVTITIHRATGKEHSSAVARVGCKGVGTAVTLRVPSARAANKAARVFRQCRYNIQQHTAVSTFNCFLRWPSFILHVHVQPQKYTVYTHKPCCGSSCKGDNGKRCHGACRLRGATCITACACWLRSIWPLAFRIYLIEFVQESV